MYGATTNRRRNRDFEFLSIRSLQYCPMGLRKTFDQVSYYFSTHFQARFLSEKGFIVSLESVCMSVCMFPSSLRRYWSDLNVQRTKSTWKFPLMTTRWQQFVSVNVIVSYSRKSESRLHFCLQRSTEILLNRGPALFFLIIFIYLLLPCS